MTEIFFQFVYDLQYFIFRLVYAMLYIYFSEVFYYISNVHIFLYKLGLYWVFKIIPHFWFIVKCWFRFIYLYGSSHYYREAIRNYGNRRIYPIVYFLKRFFIVCIWLVGFLTFLVFCYQLFKHLIVLYYSTSFRHYFRAFRNFFTYVYYSFLYNLFNKKGNLYFLNRDIYRYYERFRNFSLYYIHAFVILMFKYKRNSYRFYKFYIFEKFSNYPKILKLRKEQINILANEKIREAKDAKEWAEFMVYIEEQEATPSYQAYAARRQKEIDEMKLKRKQKAEEKAENRRKNWWVQRFVSLQEPHEYEYYAKLKEERIKKKLEDKKEKEKNNK